MTITKRGNMVYNGCRNHYIRRVKVENAQIQAKSQLDPPHLDFISGFGWMKDYLISGSFDGEVYIWNVGKKDQKPVRVRQYPNITKDKLRVVRSNPTESLLMIADVAGELKFWELNNSDLNCVLGFTPSPVSYFSYYRVLFSLPNG